jgi:hypothetical protein
MLAKKYPLGGSREYNKSQGALTLAVTATLLPGPDSAQLLPDAAIVSWFFALAVCVRE